MEQFHIIYKNVFSFEINEVSQRKTATHKEKID